MRKLSVMVIGLAMTGLAACDRGPSANGLASDTSLSRDLSLANQAQPFQRLDSLSAFETAPMAGETAAPAFVPAPVPRATARSESSSRRASASSPTRRSTTPRSTRRRTSTASTGDVDVGSRGRRSEGRVIVERNTRRDAAIGAAAGAVIGAATSKNKVKGAVIGGVAGGVLGGIIGHTIDVKRRRVP
jgi:hypothetical protein